MTRSRRAVAAIVVGALVASLGAYVLLPGLVRILRPPSQTLVLSPVGQGGQVLIRKYLSPPDFGDFVWSDQGMGALILTVGLMGVGLGVGRLIGARRSSARRVRILFAVAAVPIVAGTVVAVSGRPVGAALLGSDWNSFMASWATAYWLHAIGTAVMAVGLITLAVVVGMARAGRRPPSHAT